VDVEPSKRKKYNKAESIVKTTAHKHKLSRQKTKTKNNIKKKKKVGIFLPQQAREEDCRK